MRNNLRIELISNEKAKQLREHLLSQTPIRANGEKNICYEHPIYQDTFYGLSQAIYGSERLQELSGRSYRLESNNGHIFKITPAVEYYKIGFRMLRDNLHSVSIAYESVQDSISEIEQLHSKSRSTTSNGQPKIIFKNELYILRSNLNNFIFLIRSSLDILATFVQTIYGPSASQCTSITQLIKNLNKPNVYPNDENLLEYLNTKLPWFLLLKDVRDYLAHFGAVRFSLLESLNGGITIEIFSGIEVKEFTQNISDGFFEFMDYLNTHWSSVVLNKTT